MNLDTKKIALALVIGLSLGVPLITSANVGDFCQAAGKIPGHLNSSNQCIADELIGQSCGTDKKYDAKGDCVSSRMGQYCTALSTGTRGQYNAAGDCVAEARKPGDPCVTGGVTAAHLDSNLRCVLDAPCAGKAEGQYCETGGTAGHCDAKLTCVPNASDAGELKNNPPGTGPTEPIVSPQSGSNITLMNPLGPLNCTGSTCLMSFIQTLLSFIVRIGSVVIIVALIYVGYSFVMAQGNAGALTSAKQALQWTIIGGLILLGSQAIASAIQATIQAISVGG